jgi:hypothetical protein
MAERRNSSAGNIWRSCESLTPRYPVGKKNRTKKEKKGGRNGLNPQPLRRTSPNDGISGKENKQ